MDNQPAIKPLSTGINDFPTLIQNTKAKYVDKTALLYEMANDVDQQLFISRPRGFGKSLMLSTLRAMFEGRRELFRGLALDSLPWECWDEKKRYPVYSFNMADAVGESYDEFNDKLSDLVAGLFQKAGLPIPQDGSAQGNFDRFLRAAAKKSNTGQIVVLIDEYDEPVAKFLDDLPTFRRVHSVLHDFYEKLKSNSAVIRFMMMTGVTKLIRPSGFSGFNHVTDLSMSPRFATLLGYTHEELDGALRENVEAFGERNGWDFATAKAKLLEWYGGYRFSPQSEARVLNPVSLGSLFEEGGGELKSYWEIADDTTLVINRLKANDKMPPDLERVTATDWTLEVCDADFLPMESLLYRGGYLSIKEVVKAPRPNDADETDGPRPDTYALAPPNLEIRAILKRGYISQVLHLTEKTFDTLLDSAKRLMAEGNIRDVVESTLLGLYAAIPPEWRLKDETEAKRYFQLFFTLLGANPPPEFLTIRGNADIVVERPDAVYVIEYKYDRTAEEAIGQIRDRGYAEKWAGGPRPVTLVGVNFNPKKRNIDLPIIEPL